MQVIKVGRKLFANTPIQKLPLTTYLYRKVFRYGYAEDEITIPFRGVKLTVPTKDTTLVPGLAGGFYEQLELDVFERLAAQSRLVFDVGGSIGDTTCVVADKLSADGRLVVFEPIPENLEYIRKNVAQNNLTKQVEVEAKAVGESDGELTIYLATGSVGTHSASAKTAERSGAPAKGVQVPVVSLDSYIAKHNITALDILKIDVEGHDGFVLRGATKILRDLKPTLFIEFVSDHMRDSDFSPEEFINILMANYEHIFVVNEPKATLKPYTKADLRQLIDHSMNANLIMTDRPEHLKLVEQFIKDRAA